MRRLLTSCLLVLGFCASVPCARAADYPLPTLRGTDTFVPGFAECCSLWAGIYAGGQIGVGVTSVDFSQATQTVIANMLQVTALQNEAAVSTWAVLGKSDTRGRMWGGFVGYNTSWEKVVLGFELNYNRTDFEPGADVTPLTRIVTTSVATYDVTLTGGARIKLRHCHLPWPRRLGHGQFPALCLCRRGGGPGQSAAHVDRIWHAKLLRHPSYRDSVLLHPDSIQGECLPVRMVGRGGVDIMALPNVFLRAEFEYLAFSPYCL